MKTYILTVGLLVMFLLPSTRTLAVLFVAGKVKTVKTPPGLPDSTGIVRLVATISQDSIRYFHRQICGVRNRSQKGMRHLGTVRSLLIQHFTRNGLESSFQDTILTRQEVSLLKGGAAPVTPDTTTSFHIRNVLALKKSRHANAGTIVFCAHYDSISDSPGADDNASGIAALMEMARILSAIQTEKNILFAAFDLEEEGLLGSQLFVFGKGKQYPEKIDGVVNFDMIGYSSEEPKSQQVPEIYQQLFPQQYKLLSEDQFRGNFVLIAANEKSVPLSDVYTRAARAFVPELKVMSLSLPGDGLQAGSLADSDHAAFWFAGIPAIFIGDGAGSRNRHYHSSADKQETVNYGFMTRVIKAAVAGALAVSGSEWPADAAVVLPATGH
ncbi:M28 family metallopeptidase [Chitinophaga qingshengii]|uniref:M28 family peptidase n=1 Tax=Chitinophaga qingshengii TaxID=1569794 RepID=A0ABR7TH38_9BACT|nr:M28 family peptidase [Chitinophaga qingshengii]MBC9929280.1 M28 family peptidase [Chitinophaga qingshengii]